MNDERPIEKLLRRYAKKRGDEAGPPHELHPATRRLLQGEVARQFPRPEAERKAAAPGVFALLTRRWIVAVGVFVVLGVAAVMMLSPFTKSKNGEFLAQKSASDEFVEREAMAPAEAMSAPVAAGEKRNEPQPTRTTVARNIQVRDETSALAESVTTSGTGGSLLAGRRTDADALRKSEEAKSVSLGVSPDSATRAPGTVTVQPSARAVGTAGSADSLAFKPTDSAASRAGFDDARQRVSTTAAAPSPVAAPALSRAVADKSFVARGGDVEKDAERFYSQSFANVAPEQLRAKAAKVKSDSPITPVLASFQIQQDGNELRVIDSDGSTYRGALSAAAGGYGFAGAGGKETGTTSFQSAERPETQALSPRDIAGRQQQAQNLLYRVEGTNRTLNQNVVFTWSFVETNALAVSPAQSVSNPLPVQFPAQLQNSLIYGRAQFGAGQEIEVNAVPVSK